MSFSDPKQKLSDNSADIEAELQRLEALGPEEAKRSGTTNGFTIRKAKLIARHLGIDYFFILAASKFSPIKYFLIGS
jgi:hypothetical protein